MSCSYFSQYLLCVTRTYYLAIYNNNISLLRSVHDNIIIIVAVVESDCLS